MDFVGHKLTASFWAWKLDEDQENKNQNYVIERFVLYLAAS